MKTNYILVFILLFCIIISSCQIPNKSTGEVNVTIAGTFDVGWNRDFYQLDFGNIERCEVVNSESFEHGLEIANKGVVPVNIYMRYDNYIFSHPNSRWGFGAECRAMDPVTGNIYALEGDCWDGPLGAQYKYLEIPPTDTNVVNCLNYRHPNALAKLGIRIDVELNVSCLESAEEKYGLLAMTFEEADRVIDCDGDSGYDLGGFKLN
jgi:hypothetical protein